MNQSWHLPRAAVSALIMDGDRTLLVKRGGEPNKGLWALPGGSIEPGETAREALAREILEETCLVVEPGDVAGVHDVIARGEDGEIIFHYVIITFFARVISGELCAASDASDARWVPVEELAAYEMTPGLLDRIRRMRVSKKLGERR